MNALFVICCSSHGNTVCTDLFSLKVFSWELNYPAHSPDLNTLGHQPGIPTARHSLVLNYCKTSRERMDKKKRVCDAPKHLSDHLLQRCVGGSSSFDSESAFLHTHLECFSEAMKVLEECSDGHINQASVCFLPTRGDQIHQQFLHFRIGHADRVT